MLRKLYRFLRGVRRFYAARHADVGRQPHDEVLDKVPPHESASLPKNRKTSGFAASACELHPAAPTIRPQNSTYVNTSGICES